MFVKKTIFILPYFLDRGVIWSSPKHKNLVQSISDESQFLNCKHRLPMSLLPQKVWNSKNANLKDLRIEKWRLHHQGSSDGTEMNHVIQPPHSQRCKSQEIHIAARWMAPAPTGRKFLQKPISYIFNWNSLLSMLHCRGPPETLFLLCFFTDMGFEGLMSFRIHQCCKELKKVWPCSACRRL